MDEDLLQQAIGRLPIPEIWRKLKLPGEPPARDGIKFCSPLRPDTHPSASLTDNLTRYHDWSQNIHADSYAFFKLATQKVGRDAFRSFITLASLESQLNGDAGHHKNNRHFDWESSVKKFTEIHAARLRRERGYSEQFIDWLHRNKLVGVTFCDALGEDCISFPVRNLAGVVVGAHCFSKERNRDGKHEWRYQPPKGVKAFPLVIGDSSTASEFHFFESQFDSFAFIDLTSAFERDAVSVIATRGAQNASHIRSLQFSEKALLYGWPQNDPPGQRWFQDLVAYAPGGIRRAIIPSEHKDLNDWTRAGATAREVTEIFEKIAPVEIGGGPQSKKADALILTEGPEVDRLVTEYATNLDDLPEPMRDVAFGGIVGEIVEILEKHCEACREALLLQLLVMIGNIFGRSMRLYASRDVFPNEYAIIVGATARGRKGTSLAMVEDLLWQIDPNWLKHRRVDGIQSGEGIIHQVRDEAWGRDPKVKHSKGDPFKEVLLDVGVSDKRLMIVEEEFASLLKAAQRRGSTITEILRKTWESPICLRNSSKNSPQIATAPHISLIAHCTRDELIQTLKNVDLSNGFANRFLWCASYMARQMPNVEFLDWREHQALTDRLTSIFNTFSNSGEPRRFTRDQAAHGLWEEKYSDLISRKRAANIDGIAARDTTHILKLSLILAALDHSCLITRDHLEAAFEITEYSERSAQWIFNSNTGNRTANRMLAALRINLNGLSKSELFRELGRNVASVDIEQGLRVLMQSNLIRPQVRVIGKENIPIWKAI